MFILTVERQFKAKLTVGHRLESLDPQRWSSRFLEHPLWTFFVIYSLGHQTIQCKGSLMTVHDEFNYAVPQPPLKLGMTF